MKKIVKKLGILSLATLGIVSVASCGENKTSEVSSSSVESSSEESTSNSEAESSSESETPATKTLTTSDAYNYHQNTTNTVAVSADGVRYTYSNASYTDRTTILGLLEKYAVENSLTGLTLYGDGAIRKYNSRLTSPTGFHYIPGYGFGVFSEGNYTAGLSGETNEAYKNYYHTATADAITTVNPLNSQESTVSDFASYTDAAFVLKRLNDTQDGWRWAGDLVEDADSVKGLAIAVNPNADGKTKEFKFNIKTGADLKYATLTSKTSLTKYNGQEAKAEDYLTVYKMLFAQSVGYVRATDNFNTSQELEGASDYYNATKDATTWEELDDAYEKYLKKGVWVDSEGALHIKYRVEQDNFYGMYYAPAYQPVPKSFITDLAALAGGSTVVDGSKVWSAVNKDNGLTPVDTVLATGAYAWETWSDTIYTLKRVQTHDYDEMYNFPGVHIALDSSSKQDAEASWKKYNAGLYDSCAIPSTQLDAHRTDEDAWQETDSTTYKLNMNTCTAELWEELFGENGTVTQTDKSQYWDVKPAMANKDFTLGLSYALDRKTFATTYGRSASGNFFGNGYYADPEEGIIYNETAAHKAAVASLINDNTDEYGFSLTLAQAAFTRAAKTLTENGAYKSGDTITIEIAWQDDTSATKQGATLAEMFEKAFNESEAHTQYGLTLKIENYACKVWYDVYYSKMMIGQFDIAFGSISGNPMNPLNFLEVLKSDNSSGFTLNWGPDTNKVDDTMVYDGIAWSFDALWTAADTSALVKDGKLVEYVDTKLASSTYNTNGTRTTKVAYAAYTSDTARATFVDADGKVKEGYVVAIGYDCNGNKFVVSEDQISVENGYIVINLTKDQEDVCVQLNINVQFDVEVKKDGNWIVVEEGRTTKNNSMEVATAVEK